MANDTSLEERLRELEGRVAALEQQLTASAQRSSLPATELTMPAALATPILENETQLETRAPQPDGTDLETRAPQPASARHEPSSGSELESRLATTWLNRAGIVTLVGGVSLLLIYAFPSLGAAGKLLIGFGSATVLVTLGLYLRQRYRIFGQVLFAGGLALLYFDTYALHFVPGLRVLDEPFVPLALMTLLVVLITVAAQRMASEGVAGIALFLGYATAMLGQTTAFTLVVVALLGVTSIVFLLLNRWVVVPISSLVAVYATHAFWMLGYPGIAARATPTESFGVGLTALVLFFAIFAAAPLLLRLRQDDGKAQTLQGPTVLSPTVQVLFGGLNWLGFFGLGMAELAQHRPAWLSIFALASAVAMGGLAALARRRGRREALFEVQVVLAVASLTVASCIALIGPWLPLGWALLGLGVAVAGRGLRSLPLQLTGGSLVMVSAVIQLPFLGELPAPAFGVVVALGLTERLASPIDTPSALRGLRIPLVLAAPVLLLAALYQLTGGQWLTIGWLVAALGLFGLGMLLRSRLYRLTALGVLALTLVKVVFVDLAQLTALIRIASVVVLGVVLLIVSFLYTRLEGRLRSPAGR